MLLIGKNLGARQKDLNSKVNDAVARKVEFEEIKKQKESSDIDKLFKIDVASKYKNIDYILEILKSGDDLYISRALRSKWLYDNEFSNIVNPDYLSKNIFPHMSLRMQRKMLTAISMHIQDEARAEFFFKYLIESDTVLCHIELKFLRLISEQSRLEFINNKKSVNWKTVEEKIEHVVRDSFTIAEACIQKVQLFERDKILHRLRFLYSVSPQKYLDLLEKYAETDTVYLDILEKRPEINIRLRYGLRISKNIATKHKNRILVHPLLYLQKLNTGVLVKHSTKEEIKQYARAWLPNQVSNFWDGKYGKTYKELLKVIPSEERFKFVKGIFSEKYPGEEFEKNCAFFSSESYSIMSEEQKQIWALQNLEQEKALSNDNSYFKWYTILPFDMAFAAFKEFDLKTLEDYEILKDYGILLKACKSESDLKQLFEYYLENSTSEDARSKILFIGLVRENHKIFAFEEICWNLFQNLLLDHDVLELAKRCDLRSFQTIAVVYSIIKKKEIPEQIKFNRSTLLPLLKKGYGLTETQEKMVREFLDKSGQYKESQEELCRKLKEDVGLVKVLKPTDLKDRYRLTKFLRKLKVYFPYDTLTQEYLKMCLDCLLDVLINDSDEDFCLNVINFFVPGLFLLPNIAERDKLINEFIPKSGVNPPNPMKVAICQYAYLSRPLLDPTIMSRYIAGHSCMTYCSPILTAFVAKLPFKLAIQFLATLFQSPDWRRTFKLVFTYGFMTGGLICPLILKLLETTTDKKFRDTLYETMYFKLTMLNNERQVKMYKDFYRPMILGLHEDDFHLHEKTGILTKDLPEAVRSLHIQTEKDFMDKIVNDFIQDIGNNEQSFIQSRMATVAAYLIFYTEEEELTKTRQLANLTMTKLIDLNINGTPSQKVILWSFLTEIVKQNFKIKGRQRQYHGILTEILSQVLNSIRFEDVPYLSFWEMKLTIIWNSTLDLGNQKSQNKDYDGKTVTEELMKYYASEVNGIIEDLTATGRYNKMEVPKVAKNISDNLKELNLFLDNREDLVWLNFNIFFTEYMASFGKEEAVVMGLHVHPNRCKFSMCALHYGELLEKIKSFNYTEVLSMLREKFFLDI